LKSGKEVILSKKKHYRAARAGDLALLRELDTAGCPQSSGSIAAAIKAFSPDTVQYLHESGCKWSKNRWIQTAFRAGPEIRKIQAYLCMWNCPKPPKGMRY